MDTATDKNENPKNSMEQLEDALVLCKFGRFHMRLLFTTFAATCASTMVTTTSSYILSSAECDLEMTIMQKGVLNAMPFFGQVGAALFTGFVIDAFGRKMFLVGGNLGIFLCSIFEGFAQNYWMLIFGKLIEGIFLSFSFGATTTMVSEFTPKNVRDRVILVTCSFMSTSLIIAALMSWGLLPQMWDFQFSDYFVLHSWNIYLFICSLWSLVAAVMYYYLPESPKWLLSHGQDDKALEVLKKIYSENSGEDQNTFPVKSITMVGTTPIPTNKNSIKKQIINGLFESKDLFRIPLLWQLLLFSSTTFVSLLAYSAMRLWYPQLSTIIETYVNNHGNTETFCVMINEYENLPIIGNITVSVINMTNPEICIPHLSGTETYTNSIIMGLISLVCILTSTCLVDLVGQKPLIFITFILSGICSGVLYWTYNSIQIAILVSLTCAFVQTALSLQQNILVRVFPTSVRSLAFSFVIMSGRVGSLVGNILFPVLLEAGCMGPFISLTVVTWSVASLVYFLPNPRKDNGAGDR